MIKAMEELNDPAFLPQVRTQGTIEKMQREYSELENLPPENNEVIDDLDRARVLIAFGIAYLSLSSAPEEVAALVQKYKLPREELIGVFDWYRCK